MNAFDVIEGLLVLEQNAGSIGDFFRDNEIDCVVVYGLGRVGVRVLEALKRAGIKVECVVDRDADRITFEGVKIITPEKIKKAGSDIKAELIVVTPMEHYYDIKEELERYTDKDIISIGEIVEYCMEEESFR